MARKTPRTPTPRPRQRSRTSGKILRLEEITQRRLLGLDKQHTLVAAAMSPIEVHGPHLPLGQDLFEAYALTEHALERLARKKPEWTFVLLPPIPVAADCVPKLGSLNFPVRLVRDVAYHVLRPFALHGFSRLVFGNFHGGPRHNLALETAAVRLSREFDTACISLMSAVLGRILQDNLFYKAVENTPGRRINSEQIKKDLHAGQVETSIGLHLWPELVEHGWQDLPGLVADDPQTGKGGSRHFLFSDGAPTTPSGRIRRAAGRLRVMAESVRHFSKNTYRGYPALSSAREGRDLFEHLVGIAVEALEEFIEKGREMNGHSPLWPMRRFLLNRGVNKIFDDWLGVYSE